MSKHTSWKVAYRNRVCRWSRRRRRAGVGGVQRHYRSAPFLDPFDAALASLHLTVATRDAQRRAHGRGN